MTRYFIYLGAIILAFAAFSKAQAATLYLDDGTEIDLAVGSKVYITDVPVWRFTKFDEGGFDLRPIVPTVEVTEFCVDDGFTFGGASTTCDEEVVVDEPVEEDETECSPDGLTFGGGC